MQTTKIKVIVEKTDKILSLDNVECDSMFIGGASLNGGYACLHGDKEDAFKCYSWNCPLATSADLADIRRLEPESFAEVAEYFNLIPEEAILLTDDELQEYDTSTFGNDYMRQYYKVKSITVEGDDDLDDIIDIVREADDYDTDTLAILYKVEIVEFENL